VPSTFGKLFGKKYENMRKKIIFFIYIIVIIFLVIYSPLVMSMEAVRYDPGLKWQVLESPHFSVYFSVAQNNKQNNEDFSYNNERLAQEIADIAEETYHQINAQLDPPKHHHLQKIAIIIEDFSDYALGFATSSPHRVIRISLTAPTAKSFDMKFISWLKMVITHEYTHIAHFEMTSGPTTALRALFGQILAPNALQPIWSIEGLAVYNETKFTAGGRGIDSRYDMYLRMAALEDKFNTLDQINGYYLTSWPDGTAPYIYGQSIIHFIAQKYGEEKVIAMSKIFCEYPYLGFNHALKKAIGLNLEELYQSWKDNLKEKYQLQTQKILSQKNLTSSQQLTKYHYWVDYPRWISTLAPDGDKIAVRVFTPHSYPLIQIIDPLSPSLPLTPRSTKNRTKTQPLIKRTYGRDSSFSISPDGSKIIYAKLDDYEQFYKFYDLYLFDLKTEKETRFSEGLRARDPSWSPNPDNPQIVAVINQSGTNNLALINLPSPNSSTNENQPTNKPITKEDIVYLTDFRDDTQLSQPSWSPKGDRIALSAWRQGYQDIYILNIDPENICNSILQPIFCAKSIDLSPCWSPDGKYLFFSSDRTGIYNIFAFSFTDKKLYQVTNVLGGAFQPAISPNGTQLAFISYHATGYELHLMKMNPNSSQWTEVKIEYIKPQIIATQQDTAWPMQQQSNSLNIGYQYEKSTTTADTSSSINNNQEKISSLRLGYSYSDAEKYGFSISPELGNSFSLTYEHADKALGSDYTFDKLLFDGRKFIPLPPLHQVLALRIVAGTSSSSILESGLDEEKFKLGGNYSADNLSNTDMNTFSLRGYKPATLEGNNLLLTSLEYRFPIANIEHSLKLGPLSIFLERLSGAFFIDIGNAWESASSSNSININTENNEINYIWQDFKSSIGAELKADFNQKYDSPFTLRLGAAKALSDPKGYDIYITLGSSF